MGKAISDFIDRTLKIGYPMGSAVLIILLLITLFIWYKKERSINVEYIPTASIEIFYWMAFLFANTLGTAAGDFVADSLGFGFVHSAILFTVLLVIIVLLHYFTKVSGTLLFWLAFVLTRLFGATFGKPIVKGGLNLGTVGSLIFFCVILIFAIAKETKLEKIRNA